MMEQQNTMQKKYEELAEKLSRISENAIERETELPLTICGNSR